MYKLEFKNPITFKNDESFEVEVDITKEEVTLRATQECRSCLESVSIEDLHGRLCTNCIQTAGKFLKDTDKELLKNLTEVDISNRVCI